MKSSKNYSNSAKFLKAARRFVSPGGTDRARNVAISRINLQVSCQLGLDGFSLSLRIVFRALLAILMAAGSALGQRTEAEASSTTPAHFTTKPAAAQVTFRSKEPLSGQAF